MERLAATYRRVAAVTLSDERANRVLMHAILLDQQAEHERREAVQFRHTASRG
jgi:hypothetical protein